MGIRCERCGKFCIPFDQRTPFGCPDPEYPEPYDPSYYCESCAKPMKEMWLAHFKRGNRSGDWQKSYAEKEAAKECGLEWVHETGFVDSRTEKDVHYRYIQKDEKHFYVPFLEFYAAKRLTPSLS